MRILFISRSHITDLKGGGQEKVVYTYSRHLTAMGHTVAVAVFDKHGKPKHVVVNETHEVYRVKGIYNSFASRLPGYIQVVRKFKPDVIIMSSYQNSIYGAFIKKMTGVPVVSLAHDCFEIYGYGIKPFNFLHVVNTKYFAHKIDGIYSLNHNTAKYIIKETGLNVKEITTPIELKKDPPIKKVYRSYADTGEPFKFVFLSRFYKEKGPDYLAEAFLEFLKNQPNAECIFIGDGAYLNEFKEKYKVTNKIKCLGFIQEEDMFRILSESDVFVTPTYIKEGLVATNIQAMEVGLPVISTDSGATSEVVIGWKTGILVEPMSKDSIFEAMLFSAYNPDKMRTMAEEGKTYCNKFEARSATNELIEELIYIV